MGLVVVLAIVALVAQKQFGVARTAAPQAAPAPSAGTVRDQSQQMQEQVKQQVEGLLLQTRPVPGEENH